MGDKWISVKDRLPELEQGCRHLAQRSDYQLCPNLTESK
jgi:hypothetical protein